MKEILIVSGKGGTGKTSLSACFIQLSQNAIACDCDVDAANLHLLLSPAIREKHDFHAGWTPELDARQCISCGNCQKVCRFNAISLHDGKPEWGNGSCEGCGICADHCPAGAIKLVPRHCGCWYFSETEYGPMFHAELFPGEENSGKLIAELRKAARMKAEETKADLLISDGPPGVGCPVISSMSGVDLVVAVTEPTPSGLHDLKRLMLLAHQFELPVRVIINKWDLNGEISGQIADFCGEKNFPVIGRIPYDPMFAQLLKDGKTVLSNPDSVPAVKIKEIWKNLNNNVN